MSALDDINKKFNGNEPLTSCEQAIGTLWEDVSGCEWLAEEAAEEFAQLRTASEESEKILQDLRNYLHQQIEPIGGVGCEEEIGFIDSIDAYFDMRGGQK